MDYLITVQGQTVALWKDDSGFHLFDSHARNHLSYLSVQGSAVLLHFTDISDVVEYICRIYFGSVFNITPFALGQRQSEQQCEQSTDTATDMPALSTDGNNISHNIGRKTSQHGLSHSTNSAVTTSSPYKTDILTDVCSSNREVSHSVQSLSLLNFMRLTDHAYCANIEKSRLKRGRKAENPYIRFCMRHAVCSMRYALCGKKSNLW